MMLSSVISSLSLSKEWISCPTVDAFVRQYCNIYNTRGGGNRPSMYRNAFFFEDKSFSELKLQLPNGTSGRRSNTS